MKMNWMAAIAALFGVALISGQNNGTPTMPIQPPQPGGGGSAPLPEEPGNPAPPISAQPLPYIPPATTPSQPPPGAVLSTPAAPNPALPYECRILNWITPTRAEYDGAAFATKGELGQHLKNAHGLDVYVCPVGDEYFYSEYNLAAHMRFTHPQLTYTDPAYEKYRSKGYSWDGYGVIYTG